MIVTAHDFTRPPPLAPDLRARLAQWLGRTNTLLAELLAGMGIGVEFRFDETATMFPSEFLSQWTDRTLSFCVNLINDDSTANGAAESHPDPGDAPSPQSILVVPNPLGLDLVSRVLGEVPAQWPTERLLTPAELSVAEFVVETIIRSLKETWQAETSVDLAMGAMEQNLRRTKLFRPVEPIITCRSIAKTSAGESSWWWCMSTDFISAMFGLPMRSTNIASSKHHLEQLIRGMRTELEIRLGTVQLSGPQLAQLRVGDVVVLDQRVNEPLRASVCGEPKFLGWAGRVGDRQAFEIESEVVQTSGAAG